MSYGVFVGLSTIDVVYRVENFPPPDSKITAVDQNVFTGGPAANAAITFAHLGGKATLITALGRHPLSSLVREDLERYSVELIDLYPEFDRVPVISSVYVNRAGERNVISSNASRFGAIPVSVDDAVCAEAAVLLVDGHSMEACQFWARTARARGKQVVFDGGSWKAGTEELLRAVDTAICSADFWPPGCSTADEVIEYLQQSGVSRIAISQGASPVLFADHGRSGSVVVPQVELVDTMGAGDVLHGSYCYYAAQGCGFVEALDLAAQMASASCRYSGTRAWMKETVELRCP